MGREVSVIDKNPERIEAKKLDQKQPDEFVLLPKFHETNVF